MKKIFTQENIVGFAVAVVAGFVAIATFNKGWLPGPVKKVLS